jgi:uncharacterized protein (TIGR02147 family)
MTVRALKIFEYTDYRFFLKDFYSHQKQNSRRFSFRFFAKESGVSPSLFKDIISGRRHLSPKVMEKYARTMRLSDKETDYFRALVEFVNAKNNRTKNDAFAAMMQHRRRTNLTYLDEKQYEFYSNWYYSAIRELITLPGFREDCEWIAASINPPITPGQAKKALDVLLHLKLVKRNDGGKLELCDTIISSKAEMNSMMLRNYHHEMIRLGQEALERYDPREREVSSLTLGVSGSCFETIKKRIRDFKEEILHIAVEDKTPSQTVCQLNFQLFPLVAGEGEHPEQQQPEGRKES